MARHQLNFTNIQEVIEWALENNKKPKKTHHGGKPLRNPIFVNELKKLTTFTSNGCRNGYSENSELNKIIGCTYPELVKHIEKQFLKNMNWKNINLWHIDHIVPISNAKTIEEAKKLSHFTNLRPLWAKDNYSKKDKNLFLI